MVCSLVDIAISIQDPPLDGEKKSSWQQQAQAWRLLAMELQKAPPAVP